MLSVFYNLNCIYVIMQLLKFRISRGVREIPFMFLNIGNYHIG